AATAAYAPSLRFAIRRRPSSVVKRSMAVVLANVSHDAKTERVDVRATLFFVIVRAMSSSSSMPCSIESAPARAATRAPSRYLEWHATVAPRACAASVAGRGAVPVHGDGSAPRGAAL